jgi:hypothetical protein
MSYDLIFARPIHNIPKEQEDEVYRALTDDKPGGLFEPLPLEKINEALIEVYEDYEPATGTGIEDERGSAEVGHSAYYFWFSFRGDTDEMTDCVVALFRRFDCPVYDPQCDGLQPLDKPWGSPPGAAALGSGFQKAFARELTKLQDQVAAQKPEVREVLERELAELQEGAAALRKKQEESRAKAAALRQKEEQKREEADRKLNPQKYELIDQIAKECAGGRWERLGITAKDCGEAILISPQMTAEKKQPSSIPITFSRRLVELKFLEAIPASQPSHDSVAVARRAAAMAVNYFFGEWRIPIPQTPVFLPGGGVRYSLDEEEEKPMTKTEMRERKDWIEPYREGLLLALYADDEKSFKKLIEWPDTDLPVDEGMWNMTAADNQAHIALARVLRGDPKPKVEQIITEVLGSGRKRAIAFASAAQAVADDDAVTFVRHLKELSGLYLRKTPQLVRARRPELHVDGSILWHIGLRKRFALPELPERNLDLILRR